MTEVTFYRNSEGEFTGFRADGHSGYAEEGEDIVCAAISALVTTTINSIEAFTDEEPDLDIDEEEAYIDVSFFEAPGEKAQLLLKSLALGLEGIQSSDEAKGFIEVIYQEV